jgi:hypothetical protein
MENKPTLQLKVAVNHREICKLHGVSFRDASDIASVVHSLIEELNVGAKISIYCLDLDNHKITNLYNNFKHDKENR